MSKPSKKQWAEWAIGDPKDYTFLETGCNRGHTLAQAASVFGECHSIELNDRFFQLCENRFKDSPTCTVHHGRSEDILPGLIVQAAGPICYWLDAHGAPNAQCGGYVPLMVELALACAHDNERDIVAIDDTRCFGKDARDRNGDNWTDITLERVEAMLREGGFVNIRHWPEQMPGGRWHRSGVMKATR